MARARRPPAQWPFVVLGLLALAGVVAGVLHLIRSLPRSPVAAWQGAPERPGPDVALTRLPMGYRTTFRVDAGSPLGAQRSQEVLSVSRPFESRLATTARGGSADDLGQVLSRLGLLEIRNPKQAPTGLAVGAELAASDLRLDVSLPALLERGLVVRRERRAVLDRPCQVYRSSVPLQGTVPLVPPTGGDVVDTCVDEAGIVLAQVQRSDGRAIIRRVAVRVEEEPRFEPGTFPADVPPTVPVAEGGGRFVAVPEATGPAGRSWAIAQAPAGFVKQGRYAVVGSQSKNQLGQPVGQRQAAFADVWTRGPDVLVLDQGDAAQADDPAATDPASRPADLGPLGPGTSTVSPRLSSVRAAGTGRAYVRVAGTLAVEELEAIARALQPVERPA